MDAPRIETFTSTNRKRLQLAIGIAISVVFLWLTFRSLDPGQLLEVLATVEWLWLVPCTILFIAHFVVRAWAWGVLVRPIQPVGIRSLNAATVIGFATNNLMPFRLGEFARAYVLTAREGIPFASTFATVVLARVFDMLVLLVMVGVLLVVFPLPPELRQGAFLLIPPILIGLVFLFLLKTREEEALRFLEWCARILPRKVGDWGMGLVRSFLPGLEALRSAWDLALAFGINVVSWLLIVSYYVFVLYAFGYEVPWYGSLVLVIAVAFLIAVPSSPGYVGPYHFAIVQGMAMLPGVDLTDAEAQAFAIVMHGLQFVLTTAWGVLYLLAGSVSLREIAEMEEKSHDDETADGEPADADPAEAD